MSNFNRNIISLLIVLIISSVISCNKPVAQKVDVLSIINEFDKKTEWLDYRIALEEWDLYTTGHADSLDFYNGLYHYLLSEEGLQKIAKIRKPALSNEDDLRRFELVKDAVLGGEIELDPDVSHIRDSLSNIDINYRATFEGAESYTNDLYRIYRTDKDPVRREKAYRAYVSIGAKMHEGLEQLFKLRNQKTKRLGFNNYFTFTLQNQKININDYLQLLTRLDSLSEQPYSKILESIKEKLRMSDPEIWDIAYAYRAINNKIERYFPIDSQMVYIKSSLKDVGYDLDKYPIYFDLESRPGKSQFAYAFTIKAPYDMRVLANLTDGIQSTRTLMHEIGHTLHSAFIKQEDPLFSNTMIDGILSEGMAQTVAAFLNDKQWLVEYAHVPASVADEYLQAKKELDIIYLRTTLLRLQFEFEAYNNPNRDLNKLYWDLFEKYMMLPRHDDIYPWASIIHYTTHPVYLHNYLYADMIAAQNIAYIKDNFGPLVQNKSYRSFLTQNYFRFGAKYDWRELLKRGTDSELQPDYFIAQLGL